MSFISMRMKHFHINGFVLSLALIQRLGVTRKWANKPLNGSEAGDDFVLRKSSVSLVCKRTLFNYSWKNVRLS